MNNPKPLVRNAHRTLGGSRQEQKDLAQKLHDDVMTLLVKYAEDTEGCTFIGLKETLARGVEDVL